MENIYNNELKYSKINPNGGVGYNYTNYINDSNSVQRSLNETMKQGSLDVVYQPIVNHVQNTVYAHEALSRPQLEGNLIQPDVWFLAAYENGRSVEADLLAVTSGVKTFEFSSPTSSDPKSTPLFVNVMPSSLIETSFLDGLERLFRDDLCHPEQLVIEIIEYVSYDPISISKRVAAMRSLGVRIALDDVGIGSASLRMIVETQPDFIKVDRSLIQGISVSSSKRRLLSHLVSYMESGDAVIAEGLETVEDLLAVKEMGANLSQGYYWAHPMRMGELVSLRTDN
ncbi:MAG: EAL domain-containing protein [Bacilli bacterium]